MLAYNKNTPVLFLIFNRPNITKTTFEVIKKSQPKRLYIAADGPRTREEAVLCNKAREIINHIDWDCELKTLFRTENLGCKKAVSSAITWFFENEEEGIILEDDCLPSESFFGFCSQMLKLYRTDEKIGHISGSNFQLGNIRGDATYYFSNLTHVWGWAGWRRVWKDYDVDMKSFPEFKRENKIEQLNSLLPFKEQWLNNLENTYLGKVNTWDFQYAYLNLLNKRMSVMPNVNMVSNIGFGNDATHTDAVSQNIFSNLNREEITSIKHPEVIEVNTEADWFTQTREHKRPEQQQLKKKNIFSRTWKKIKYLIR